MAIRIYGHHIRITDIFREYIESKIPRLEKYADPIQQLEIVLEEDGPNTLAELRFKAGPIEVNVKQKDPDQARAIDLLIDKAETALKKQHDLIKGRRKNAHSATAAAKKANFSPDADPLPLVNPDGPELADGRKGAGGDGDRSSRADGDGREVPALHEKLNIRIFRSPKSITGPMTVEEAAEELFFRDENFLCFNNADTDGVSIMYRRKDGNFALMHADGRG